MLPLRRYHRRVRVLTGRLYPVRWPTRNSVAVPGRTGLRSAGRRTARCG
jgi:hypothetical protein